MKSDGRQSDGRQSDGMWDWEEEGVKRKEGEGQKKEMGAIGTGALYYLLHVV